MQYSMKQCNNGSLFMMDIGYDSLTKFKPLKLKKKTIVMIRILCGAQHSPPLPMCTFSPFRLGTSTFWTIHPYNNHGIMIEVT